MGAVSFSIDVDLIRFFKRFLPIETFIETGTLKGDTVAAVRPYFARTVSIELSDEYYQDAVKRFRDDPDVVLLKGDSAALIGGLARDVDETPAMFWLDAHWCSDDEQKAEGARSQCPLLGEIRAIGRIHPESVVLIDDARLFLCTPGRPHDYGQWPDFHDIVKALLELSPVHRMMVANDVIVFYPEALLEPFQRFVHETGVDWLEVVNTFRDWPRLSREYETLSEAHETLARIHQETVRELAALRRACDEERRRHDADRRETAAVLSAREEAWGRIAQETDRNRALMEDLIRQKDAAIAQLETIADMRRQTIVHRDRVIQRLESRRFFKRATLWAASIFRRNL
ncbi:hypothetical protein [Desulfococcus sp.]|uniref:hypothetical protein n=1 Tax=Desulfococcus sp. TaxID=2025834 RepID=UPI003593A4A9